MPEDRQASSSSTSWEQLQFEFDETGNPDNQGGNDQQVRETHEPSWSSPGRSRAHETPDRDR